MNTHMPNTHRCTHPWDGAVGLCNICREQRRASLLRHGPLVVEGLQSGTDSGRRFEVGLLPYPAFELRERPASWPAVINISPTSIFKGNAKSTEQGTQALYQKSCPALLWGLMSQFKKLPQLNQRCQPTDLRLYVTGYMCLYTACNYQELYLHIISSYFS